MEQGNSEDNEETRKEGAEALEQELASEKKRNDELLTRLKYIQADLENYRKRAEKEVGEAGESSVRGLVTRLLVVMDELDLAVKHAGGDGDSGNLGEGIKMVQKNLWGTLESAGLQRIEALGKEFDPSMHEAVEKVQGDGDEDTVVEELRPGYSFRGRIIRPSMVKVQLAKRKPAEEAKASE